MDMMQKERFGRDAFDRIKNRQVRGASAIAVFAIETMKQYIENLESTLTTTEFKDRVIELGNYLKSARPTTISLPNSINTILVPIIQSHELSQSVEEMRETALHALDHYLELSKGAISKIGELGSKRIRNGDVILTHSHSAAALSVIERAHKDGKSPRVICTETRPQRQGYTTARDLCKSGIDTTMIVDSCVRFVMDDVDKVVVGADGVSVNGAVVSKIGVSQIATLAHESRVKVLVACETSKFDPSSIWGNLLKIEERDPAEVVQRELLGDHPTLRIRNPQFDITPPEYIDLLVTERGLIPPGGVYGLMTQLFSQQMKYFGADS